jgi:Flp pilus assembly protein TadG
MLARCTIVNSRLRLRVHIKAPGPECFDANAKRQAVIRRGALAVEAAVVYPVMIFLLLGMIAGGMAVFRYQQGAGQAREAARWAAVRGSDWQKATDQASPTQAEILQKAVAPLAAGMDLKSLVVQVSWVDAATGQIVAWDQAPKDPLSLTKTGDYATNKVRVSVTYQFSPDVFFFGSLQLNSVCEFPMAY